MLGKRSQNKFQGVSRSVPKIYELNIRQNIFSDFSSPRLGVQLMRGGGLYGGFYGSFQWSVVSVEGRRLFVSKRAFTRILILMHKRKRTRN